MVAASAGYAESTNQWTGAVNDYDWTNPGNYQNGIPSAGDVVSLPGGTSVQLNDAASFTFVNTLGGICPASNATLTVTLAANVTNTLDVPFTAYPAVNSPYYGRLVKAGGGTLLLPSMRRDNGQTGEKCHYLDYYCRFDINEGDVVLNQSTGGKNGQLGVVTIESGATLFTYGDPTLDKMSATICATWFAEMWGSGSLRAMVQPKVKYQYFWLHPYAFTPVDSVFSGDIGENLRIYCEGRWQLTGTQSVCDPNTMVADNRGRGAAGPRLAVAKFGNGRNDPSSIGKGNTPTLSFRTNGGYFLYTGNGETTDRKFHTQSSNTPTQPSFIDAGANGGLNIAGDVAVSHFQGRMERLVLTGSNSVPCRISGELTSGDQQQSSGGATGGLFFIKRGSGTWRFADYVNGNTLNVGKRNNCTGFTIEEGTLQFDSLADTNKYCSLGLGTRLQEPYSGVYDSSRNVDYFFRLGRTNATHSIPTLELSGLGSADWGVNVGTRKVAMAGSGRISNASTNRFRLGGVSALAGGAEAVKYLHLGGTRDGGDEILDLTDGAGKLGVVKDGSGTWTLGGDINFTGLLDVREGTLVVKRYNSRNTWFRFTITEMLQNSDFYYHYFEEAGGRTDIYPLGKQYQPGLAEFGLFDTNGIQLNKGVTNCWKSSEVEAGGIAYDYAGVGGTNTIQYNGTPDNYSLDKLCDSKFSSTVHSWWAGNCGGGNLSQTNSSGWASFVLCLPPDAAEVSSWDVGQFYRLDASSCWRDITACILESSPDGVNWSVVTNVTRIPLPTHDTSLQKFWCSDFSTTVTPHTGWPLQGDSGRTWTVMPNTPVKVAAGATLRADISANEAAGAPVLNDITLSASGGGTIDGFAFAASGTLSIENMPAASGRVDIPVAFVNATGLGNMAKWSLYLDGAVDQTKSLMVSASGVSIVDRGLQVILR